MYHDLDDDEIITKNELMSSLVQWHTVKSRLNTVQSTLDDALTSEEITGKKDVSLLETMLFSRFERPLTFISVFTIVYFLC